MTGTITKIILTRGFGFVVADDDAEDYFMHVEDIDESVRWETLRKGVRVKFEGKMIKSGKGNQLRAMGVTVIE